MGQPRRTRRTMEGAQKQAEVIRLRMKGVSFTDIAAQVGFHDASGAYRSYKRAMMATIQEPADEMRKMERERLNAREAELDEWAAEAVRQLRLDQVMVSHGQVVIDKATGQPVIDEGTKLAALDRLTRLGALRAQIGAERRKLDGLDAPTRKIVEVVDEASVDKAIADLEAKLADNDPGHRSTEVEDPSAS